MTVSVVITREAGVSVFITPGCVHFGAVFVLQAGHADVFGSKTVWSGIIAGGVVVVGALDASSLEAGRSVREVSAVFVLSAGDTQPVVRVTSGSVDVSALLVVSATEIVITIFVSVSVTIRVAVSVTVSVSIAIRVSIGRRAAVVLLTPQNAASDLRVLVAEYREVVGHRGVVAPRAVARRRDVVSLRMVPDAIRDARIPGLTVGHGRWAFFSERIGYADVS